MSRKRRAAIALGVLGAVAFGAGALALGDPGTRTVVDYALWRATAAEAGETRRIPVRGATLYCELHGHGAPVLVLHGGLSFVEAMGGVIRRLAGHRRVVALDSRGHGRSTDDTGALSYARMADDAVAALDALGLERVDVVGWSDGGIVGLDLALRHPERVGKLVAIGSNYRTDGYSEAGRATIASARADAPELAGARLFYRRVAPEPARWPTLVRKVADMWHREPSYADADLARIGAPTLLVLGEHDDVRLDHAEAMARLMPRARVRVIAGTTHLVPLEQPQQLAAEISRFLDAP